MRKFKILPLLLLLLTMATSARSTEENTKDVYPLEQWQARSFRRGTLPETRKRRSFLLVGRNRLAIARTLEPG